MNRMLGGAPLECEDPADGLRISTIDTEKVTGFSREKTDSTAPKVFVNVRQIAWAQQFL
jgi:hypothetical protein